MAGSGCRNEGLEEVHFYRESLFYDFVWKRFVSMEKKVCFYGKGSFLRRRPISIEEGFFYRGGMFLRWRLIFTAGSYLYSGSVFLQRRLISTAEVYFYGDSVQFYGEGLFLRKGQFKSNWPISCMKREEPVRGADECLCTESVVLKCEAVALVGHCFLVKPGLEQTRF